MRTLMLQLPLGEPTAHTAYPHAWVQADGSPAPLSLKSAPAHLLPAAERHTDVVALVPAAALSWHKVDLPIGLHKQGSRIEAALQGLLEERLLDDATQLHMALPPQWKHLPSAWVAVCNRAWLRAHVSALESAGLTVHHIVPEFTPDTEALHITATGDSTSGWLWLRQSGRGVWGLPWAAVQTATLGLSTEEREAAQIDAEPALVAAASDQLEMPARLVPPHQHWMAALGSGWDLAQFEFQAHARARHLKAVQRAASQLWQHPQWRMARWGLVALLGAQLLGVQAWTWKTRADWQAQQQSWTQILRESFPGTTVVVDAPLQMQQQVARLREGSGALNPADLESMLEALGQALPAGVAAPRRWAYQPGQLRLSQWPLEATDQAQVQQHLNPKGYQLRAEGESWLMSAGAPQ